VNGPNAPNDPNALNAPNAPNDPNALNAPNAPNDPNALNDRTTDSKMTVHDELSSGNRKLRSGSHEVKR
jgi:hypothetical protein